MLKRNLKKFLLLIDFLKGCRHKTNKITNNRLVIVTRHEYIQFVLPDTVSNYKITQLSHTHSCNLHTYCHCHWMSISLSQHHDNHKKGYYSSSHKNNCSITDYKTIRLENTKFSVVKNSLIFLIKVGKIVFQVHELNTWE